MRIRLKLSIVLISFLFSLTATAASKQDLRVAEATDVIDQLLRIPEQSIPPSLLSRAYAIAVIPDLIKVGFGLGARRGKGILVVRRNDNSWSNPAFITMTGGSIGWQIGAQSSDIVLVFKSRKGIGDIENGKLTLGANASIAAGPVGRHTEIATDIRFEVEVYSYSRSRGLFVGVALEGASLAMDRRSNAAYYASSSITPGEIFESSGNAAPASANNFVQVLTAQTRRLPRQPGMDAGLVSDDYDPDPKSKVRTFAIGDPDSPSDEYSEVAQKY